MFTIPTMRNLLTLGGQYQFNKLQDTTGAVGSAVIKMDAYQWALFAEDEFFLMENLILTGGIRLDKHEHFGSHWSPRGYVVYHPWNEFTIKGGVSTAFKTPSLKQLSPNYAYPTQQGAAVMYGDPNLKPEESISWELGASWHKRNGFLLSATYFDTHFKNKLTNYNTGTIDPATGKNLFKYDNIGKAVIRGVEASLVFPFEMVSDSLRDFKLTANYTYIFSERQSDEELYGNGQSTKGAAFTLTPKHKFDVRLDWQALAELNIYARVEYLGKQEYAGLRTGYSGGSRYSDPLTTLDLGASYDVTENVKISFSVLNVTDERRIPGDYSGTDWGIIEDGRRFWLGTTVNF